MATMAIDNKNLKRKAHPLLINVFTALKGSQFYFLFYSSEPGGQLFKN